MRGLCNPMFLMLATWVEVLSIRLENNQDQDLPCVHVFGRALGTCCTPKCNDADEPELIGSKWRDRSIGLHSCIASGEVYKADKGNTDENGERLMETMTDEDVNPYFASRPLVKSEYLCLERCQITNTDGTNETETLVRSGGALTPKCVPKLAWRASFKVPAADD
ncbi:unnamed protein product [Durusdinium trenchii]|uniref:Secreted protein n=1 Tax=Durusdinium trenchii TaxID=1381693 RepID=A0ABP0I5M2_9DINO